MPSENFSLRHGAVRKPDTAERPPAQYPRRAVLAALAAAIGAPRMAAGAETPADAQPADPHTIVVFGDSQAEGLAVGLRHISHQFPGAKIQNRTKAGTAISQPQNYDWPAAIGDYVPDPTVNTAVLMFGGNDRLPMHPTTGAAIPFRSPAWNETYRSRVAAILHSLSDKKLRVVWVSQPICREAHYSQDMEFLNTIYREEAASGGATYLDIWTLIADAGQFAAYGRTLDGVTARLRLDDGIHFTPSGYEIIANRVMQTIETPTDAPT
jgi:hypothetical protein